MLRASWFYDKSSMFRICNLYLHRSEFVLITTTFFKFATSQQSRQYDIYIYTYYLYLYGFKSAQEALPEVRINEDGRIYCGALETATSYNPKHLSEAWPLQTGLESTILSPDVKTNSPIGSNSSYIISFYILKYLWWTIGRPLPSGKCILAYMSSCICVSRPVLPKTFQECKHYVQFLGFGLETTTWFTTCYCHCD